jgi:chromosome segregation ATPase
MFSNFFSKIDLQFPMKSNMDYRGFSLRTLSRLQEVCQSTPEVSTLLLKLNASIKEDSSQLLKLLDEEIQRQATQISYLESLVGKFEGIINQQTQTLEEAVEENEALTAKVSQMEQEIQSLKARLTRKPKLVKQLSTMPIVYNRLSGSFQYTEPKTDGAASACAASCGAESCGQSSSSTDRHP